LLENKLFRAVPSEKGIYAFNPQYKLKSDQKRVLIFYKNVDQPIKRGNSDMVEFLHPILAVLLCLFDGKKNLKTVVDEFADLTGLKRESINTLVSGLVENKTGIKVEYNGRNFYFPQNTLIKAGNKNDVFQYNPFDFLIPNRQLDFERRKLYEPLDTTIILNNQCESGCIYCYVDKRKSHPCQIPFERIVELIREARELQMRSFTPEGGELFTYKYWKELLKALVENHFDPVITTKYPLNERHIKELKDIGIKRTNLSLDTIDRSHMGKLLNVKENYYDLILKTLKDLNDNDFDICIQSQVTSINQDSIPGLLNYLSGFENIHCIKIRASSFSLYPKKDRNQYLWLRPDKNKLDKINDLVIQLREKHGDKVQWLFHRYPERKKYINPAIQEKQVLFKNRPQCSGNFHSFFILPDGKVTICEELYWHPQFIIGDLMQQSILEAWNSEKALSLYHFSKDSVREHSACKRCADFDRCHQEQGVCWKQVLYAYGEENWDYPDPRCPYAPQPFNEFWIE
jgi:radical SAM protein with 4Fe4S-binding SPASM domain